MINDDVFKADSVLIVFGSNVKKARECRNFTKKLVADLASYDRGSLNRLEEGKINIKLLTAVKIAKVLDVSFPALFSRNYVDVHATESNGNSLCKFQEDDYLLVFRENFSKMLLQYSMCQLEVTDITGINEQMVSRIVNGTKKNPTLKTLYALAYSVNQEMNNMFSRTKQNEEEI